MAGRLLGSSWLCGSITARMLTPPGVLSPRDCSRLARSPSTWLPGNLTTCTRHPTKVRLYLVDGLSCPPVERSLGMKKPFCVSCRPVWPCSRSASPKVNLRDRDGLGQATVGVMWRRAHLRLTCLPGALKLPPATIASPNCLGRLVLTVTEPLLDIARTEYLGCLLTVCGWGCYA